MKQAKNIFRGSKIIVIVIGYWESNKLDIKMLRPTFIRVIESIPRELTIALVKAEINLNAQITSKRKKKIMQLYQENKRATCR